MVLTWNTCLPTDTQHSVCINVLFWIYIQKRDQLDFLKFHNTVLHSISCKNLHLGINLNSSNLLRFLYLFAPVITLSSGEHCGSGIPFRTCSVAFCHIAGTKVIPKTCTNRVFVRCLIVMYFFGNFCRCTCAMLIFEKCLPWPNTLYVFHLKGYCSVFRINWYKLSE